MKSKLLTILLAASLLCFPKQNQAQAPNLGTAANYVLFTSVGAITSTPICHITGNVGSNSGAGTGFGNVNGQMHSGDGSTAQCASDLLIAYGELSAAIPGFFPAPLLGNGQVLNAGVYSIAGPTTLNLDLTLDAQGDPSAVFIFQIQAAFSSGANAKVKLINGAEACNVFWKIEGAVNLAAGTSMKGTIVANNAAITMNANDTLEGRALSTAGAISVTGTLAYTPSGCGSPILTGPAAPVFSASGCYSLFSGNGALNNSGITHVTGDVGTNVGLTVGFNPLFVGGLIHAIPDASTAAAAADLLNVYTYLNTLTTDIQLLFPAQFGNNLVLTPHTYLLNAATSLTDTLYLDAQGNPNAVFVILINGAFSTSTFSNVLLINGAKAQNVFWKVEGAVSINDFSVFSGTIIANNGALNLTTGVVLNGAAFTTTGAFSTVAITANTILASVTTQPVNQAACIGDSISFSVVASGAGLTYQWRKGTVDLIDGGDISGATTPTLTINPVSLADASSDYSVFITCTCGQNDSSVHVSLVVNTAPIINTQPISQMACPGDTLKITVLATGAGLTYQWRKGNVNLVSAGNVLDATSTTLLIFPTTAADTASNYSVVITGSCPPAITSQMASFRFANPIITTTSQNQTVCAGGSASLSVVATGSGLTYQWRKGNVNLVNAGAISGATSATLTINPVAVSDAAANYNVIVSGTCSPNDTSVNVSLLINSLPTISTGPSNQIVCLGSPASFTVAATGTNLTYQWRKGLVNLINGVAISGANTATLTINPTVLSDAAANYNVVVSGTCLPAATSVNVSLSINTAPSITTQPSNQTVCAGSSASFTIVAAGTGLTFQWRKGLVNLVNGVSISGATSATVTLNPTSALDAAANYNVVVSGTCLPASTSANVSLIINTAPSISSQPTSQTVCAGSSLTFTVVATGTGLTFQWRKGLVNILNGGAISGATSASLIINPTLVSDAAANYNVLVSGTCLPSVASANVTLNVNAAPSITTQPVPQTVCAGSSASFTVVTTGTGLTFQWRKGLVNLVNGGNISGATTATLTINPAAVSDAAANYNVVVTGTCAPISTSNSVSLIINTAPVITSQPANQTSGSGTSVSFTVAATGTGLTFQWRKGLVNLVNGGNISGATTGTLTINPATIADVANNYNVVITGTCGVAVSSANATLTITAAPIITTPPSNQTVCEGNSASFTVVASGTALTYQWRKGLVNLVNGGNISGATSATLTINPATTVDASANYNVVVSGSTLPNATSINVSLTINTATIITTQPANQISSTGASVSFTVSATGTGLTFQWRKGLVNLVNGGNISGVTTGTLTINPATIADAANNYNVVITGTCGVAVSSANVNLTITDAPVIITAPSNQTVCEGSSASFTVSATGTNLTYQWRNGLVNLVNGGNISGATTATLTINPATTADASANYNVVVSGTTLPNATSINVSLIINTAPVITSQPVNQVSGSGASVSFTVAATGTGLAYQWRKGLLNLINTGNISGVNTSTLTINPATISDEASDYNVVISGTCGVAVSSAIASLTITDAPIIITEPANQTACEGNSASFTVVATGTGLTYQWRNGIANLVNGGSISGATSATLTINPATAADASANYNVVVSGTTLPNAISINVSLIINTAPVITSQPVNQVSGSGASVSFTVAATGTGLAYQWRKGLLNLINTGNISGVNTSTLTINPATISDEASDYNVVISGTCGVAVSSAIASLTITDAPIIITEPANQTVCEGNSASFTVVATGTGLTYQWRNGLVNLVNGGTISGATSATLTINPATATDASANYNVVVSGTTLPNAISINVSLIINTAPVITSQPVNQVSGTGASVSFTVAATGTGLTFQWRKGLVNLVNAGNISGVNTATLTINPATITDAANDYNVVITGTCGVAISSADATLTITDAPIIITEPSNQTVCEGDLASFTVLASGTGLTYQWRNGLINLVNGGNILGATSATLIINPATAADASANYNVVVSGTTLPNATSINVSLTINTVTFITTQPANQVSGSGASVSFTVSASGAGLTYKWRKGLVYLINAGNISGVTTATLTINPATIADTASNYNVEIIGFCGVALHSVDASLTITDAPIIITEPSDQSVCDGNAASFTVFATGSGLSYQWRNGLVNLVNGANISGATSATLTINPATAADASANYNVVVSGVALPSATSINATLTINPTPIVNQVANQNLCNSDQSAAIIFAGGVLGTTYNWVNSNASIGLLANGNGDINSFTAINVGLFSELATITVSPVANGCTGASINFTITVNNCTSADLSVLKTVDNANPIVGHHVTFTIKATNNGLSNASGVIVADTLQSGYTIISAVASIGTYNSTTGIWTIGNLKSGVSEFLIIEVLVNSVGNYMNTAAIQGDEFDSDLSNNSSTIETYPSDFFIPEGFSPNGDGINDLFVIRGIENYPANSIAIYNRWGNKVYEASPYKSTWSGKCTIGMSVGGDQLPIGTYFYVLNLGDTSSPIKGTIYLNE